MQQGTGKLKRRRTAVVTIAGVVVIFPATMAVAPDATSVKPDVAATTPVQETVTALAVKEMDPKLKLPRRIDKLGIEVVAMRLTSAGYMLDFRYRVLDPKKAKPLLDKKIHPQLIDQASGAVMAVPAPPKIGSLRQTPPVAQAGLVYLAIFANPGQFIKAGNKVTVVYGDYKIENLVVE